MKKHIFSMIFYILGFITLLLLFLLLEQPFLLVFTFVYALLPSIILPLYFSGIKKAHFRAYSKAAYVEKERSLPIMFELSNPSFSPFFLTTVEFTVNNIYYPNDYTHSLSIHVMPRSIKSVLVPVDTMKIGVVKLVVNKVTLTDPLHFFSFTLPEGAVLELPVFPEEKPQNDLPLTPASDGLEEYTESDAKGSVSSDIKEIREYRPGDRLQRIHWKLSAKLDDLFVKEMAHTSILSLVLLPELTREKIEDTVAVLLGCIHILQSREERFEIGLYNDNAVDFTFLQTYDEASRIEVLTRLYYLPLYEGETTAKDAFFASGIKKATVIEIIGDEVNIIPAE